MREIQGHECVDIMKNVEARRKRLLMNSLNTATEEVSAREQRRIDMGGAEPRWLLAGILFLAAGLILYVNFNPTEQVVPVKTTDILYPGWNYCNSNGCHHPDLTTGKKYGEYWDWRRKNNL